MFNNINYVKYFYNNFFSKKRNRKIYRPSAVVFGLIFIFALLGIFPEVRVCKSTEFRLAAWNIRIMSNKSRTDLSVRMPQYEYEKSYT